MEIKSLKTIRFTKLVKESGKPVPVTLWTAPEEDREFAKAIREERVLTVVQRNVGAKADYGLVGFFKEPLATYLVFPRKLAHPPETRVIGIKYDELAEEKPKGPLHKPKAHEPPQVRMRAAVTARKEKEEQEQPQSPKTRSSEPEQPTQKPLPPSPPPPQLHLYRANVEITTRQVLRIEVEAASVKEAAQIVKEKVAQLQPDLATATIKKRIGAPKKI